jgi:arsenate reductase (glutaredoxin)
MIQVLHNARCSKSREALAWLDERKINYETIDYLNEELTPFFLEDLLDKLGVEASEILRSNEAVWKENYKHLDLSEEELLMVMVEEPKLIQRPIVINGEKAVLARPAERIAEIL